MQQLTEERFLTPGVCQRHVETHRTHRHPVELLAMLLDCIGHSDGSLLAKATKTIFCASSQVFNLLSYVSDLQVRSSISCIHA